MILERLIFPQANFDHKDMFIRGSDSSLISKGRDLSFDTYYNSFSYTKYRDYTNADDVTFKADFFGRATVQLCVYDGEEHIIHECEAENNVEITIPFKELPQNGFLYPKFTALTDCEIYGGGYYSDCKSSDINACIGICTYKREEYVRKNLEILRSFDFRFINRIFVSDNGNTLECNELSDNFIRVVHNKNYGGSGGFTRCMIDACDGGYSHIIVMDDDVVFHPEILERMTVFLSILNSENKCLHISAAMLSLSMPYVQYEAGAKWNGKYIEHLGHNFDVRDKDVLLENTSFPIPDYGSWWCFCLPVEDIRKNGLSYPFFIKFDDAEYGIRNRAHGKIITMNGIAVSHEDFDKKYSTHLEYYGIRNQLVLNAVTLEKSFALTMRRLIASTVKHLFSYRYDTMPLIIRAFNDFLQGPEFFETAEDDKVNAEIMSMRTKMQPLSAVEGWGTDRCAMGDNEKDNYLLSVITAGGHIIPSVFLKKKIKCVPISGTTISSCLGYKTTVQYQSGSPECMILSRNVKKYFYWLFKVIGLAVKLCFRYSRVKKQYISEKQRITSMDFWKKRLSI